jgi:transposase-like protein
MTKPYSVAFKNKMVQRLTGKNAVTASQLARETGIRQQNLSRWLDDARSLPVVADKPNLVTRERTVEQKARVLAEASRLLVAACPPPAEPHGARGDWLAGTLACNAIGPTARS